MKLPIRLLVGLSCCLAGAACGGDPPDTPRPVEEPTVAATTIHRGTANFAGGLHSFRPCGAEEPLWISAGAGLLGEDGAQFELFVVVEGTRRPAPPDGPGSEFAAAIAIDYVLYAFVEEGPGCDFEWDTFHYRARGNEPFWMLEVSDDGMRLVRPGEPDERWTDVTVADTAEGLVYQPQRSVDPVPADPRDSSMRLVMRR
jgi:uncharacterized membrane protein